MTKHTNKRITQRKNRLKKMVRRLEKKKSNLGHDHIHETDQIIEIRNSYFALDNSIDFRNEFKPAKNQKHNGYSALYSVVALLDCYSDEEVCEKQLLDQLQKSTDKQIKTINFRSVFDLLIENNTISGFAVLEKHDNAKKVLNVIKVLLESKIPIVANFSLPIDAVSKSCIDSGVINHKWITGVNHSVTLVGYDDNMVRNNETGFLIFKNSWGNEWGESGFGYLSYNYILYKKYHTLMMLYLEEPDTFNYGIRKN